jgi:hypothetical protein
MRTLKKSITFSIIPRNQGILLHSFGAPVGLHVIPVVMRKFCVLRTTSLFIYLLQKLMHVRQLGLLNYARLE